MSNFPRKPLPYGRQELDEDDLATVLETLRSDWLTTGPKVSEFEEAFAAATGCQHAVAVCNGTAALHCAMAALGVTAGDEVIVPTITFVATANAVVFQGATPIFADVDAATLLLDPAKVERLITPRTKVIAAVDYAGQPCDYPALREIANRHGVRILDDACHALGGALYGHAVGSLADVSTFSLHPVKPITTGEGGVVTTNDAEVARRARVFRGHGIENDHRAREKSGTFAYDMVTLGYNYRLTDFQCALGISQLRKLPKWVQRRQQLASLYDRTLADLPVEPLGVRPGVTHGYHLYVVRLPSWADRGQVFSEMRTAGIGVNVHYSPVHLHTFYRNTFGYGPGLCPIAEAAAERILTLPIFPAMTDGDVDLIAKALSDSLK